MHKGGARILSAAVGILLIATTLLGCAGPEIGNSNGFSPYWRWKQIETEHFRISFPEHVQEVGRRSAEYFEEAHRILAPRLYWEPFKKTAVVIVDNTDSPNGWTSPQLSPGIVLYASMPGPESELNYHDNWLRLLILHEYTHFLNLDITEDLYVPLRWVFGNSLLPNVAWHRWMLEGLAIYMETRHTRGGRGRSSYFEMLLRAAVLEQTLDTHQGVTLDRLTGESPYFPFGNQWYVYGYQLMNAFAQSRRTGMTHDGDDILSSPEDALGLLSKRSGRRVPYLSDWNSENITGKVWGKHWDAWVFETRERIQTQLKTIRSQPITSWELLTQPSQTESLQLQDPSISPNGRWLAYSTYASNDWEALWLRDLSQPQAAPIRIDEPFNAGQVSWSPDSRWMFYSSMRRNAVFELFYDIYAYDRESRRTVLLTHGRRAQDPEVSPDGKSLAFKVATPGYNTLIECEIDWSSGEPALKEEKVLYHTEFLTRIAAPTYAPDGSKIYFSEHRADHFSEEIRAWNRSDQKIQTLVDNGAFNYFPWVVRTGPRKGTLYYTSDASGVSNLHELGRGQVSNFETGVRMAAVTPDGIAYAAGFSSHGWDLVRFKPGDVALKTTSVAITPPPAPQAPDLPPAAPVSAEPNSPDSSTPEISDYSAWPSVVPIRWSPYAFYGAGAFKFSGLINGNDALDLHRYGAFLGFTTSVPKVDWGVSYANRNLGPTIAFTVQDQTTGWTTSSAGLVNYYRTGLLEASAAFPWRFTRSTLTPSVSFVASQENLSVPGGNPSDFDIVSRGLYVPQLNVGLAYVYGRSSPLALTTEAGRISTVGWRTYVYSGQPAGKLYASHTEFFRLGRTQVVLVPSLKGTYTLTPTNFSGAYANTVGRQADFSLINVINRTSLFATNGLGQMSLRGYPGQRYIARGSAVASFDTRFPIFRFFRGLGTLPIFFDGFQGLAFAETAIFPTGEPGANLLPSFGGGLLFESEIFLQLPLSISVQYQGGYRQDLGGSHDIVFQISSTGLGF